jgi:Domain of unknown function (DUF1998)
VSVVEATPRHQKIGKLRPSQIVTQHGPGAVVDLPDLSVIVAGTDQWFVTPRDRVTEPRLEKFLRVSGLYRPPQPGPGAFGGVPSYVFPGWLVCPRCRLLALVDDFRQVGRWGSVEFQCVRQDKHPGNRAPQAFPARFMVACVRGHLDDFPWWTWVHGAGSSPCKGPLELRDLGQTGGIGDLLVVCTSCDQRKSLGNAFDRAQSGLACSGRRPWLGPVDHEACTEQPRTLLRGASNAYFPIVASALSIPPWSDPVHTDVNPYREALQQADTIEMLKAGLEGGFYKVGDLLDRYTVEQIWLALHPDPETDRGLKRDEWASFLDPERAQIPGAEFEVSRRQVPPRFVDELADIVAATRLREVRALRAFTRIDSGMDLGEADFEQLEIQPAKLGTPAISWLPGIDLRGEGVFVRLAEAPLREWEREAAVAAEAGIREQNHAEWLARRDREARPFPGMRFILLHTLAHVLIRQLAFDCGYSASALRERIYCDDGEDPMAGILIYTATSDSEGSLGGLVDQARSDRLGSLLLDGLRDSAFCASDPLCSSSDVGAAAQLNGAACHACLLLAETSCENGNHLLDRSVLTPTVSRSDLAFFNV